ncbi:MAG TPA: response regulator transcription factor [Ohtaekwangia sp.]|nr:response regulator transcription factor [Ohtaekwangia sp.]
MNFASTRIFIADPQPLTAAGISYLIAGKPEMTIVGSLKNGQALIEQIQETNADLLIVDYNIPGFPNKNDLIQVASEMPGLKILIISNDSHKETILELLQTGIQGYLTKDCSREEILLAVQSTAKGEKFYCHKILDIVMAKHMAPVEEDCGPTVLTARETELLTLIAKGQSTQKIANSLNLSPHTVHTHRKNIIRKLNIKSPTEFVIYAIDLGLIKP